MKVSELIEKLGLTAFTGAVGVEREIAGGYTSDLLSDVMGNAKEGNVWITLQNHMNVIAIASLKELACIILVKGITPAPEIIEKAIAEEIPVLGSNENTFNLNGKIYALLN
ncbi:MAG TPA: DRTGG domain-containing protein [Prolixibacteraceae bacterium]|nr:serine kinase [Bacteroidales bacterium]HQN93142.1 DRTGG domain-containing protein [Prolixibacteraceae bacterium]